MLTHISPLNASSVLATAGFLGLHAVAEYALDLALTVVAQLSRPDDFQAWERFVGFGEGGLAHVGKANGNGVHPPGVNGFAGAGADGFEPFGVRILQALLDRVPKLARELGAFGRDPGRNTKDDADGQDALAEVLAVLSFASFKQALEGPDFPALSDMDRCASPSCSAKIHCSHVLLGAVQYAKQCVAVRKRVGPSDFEEACVPSPRPTRALADPSTIISQRQFSSILACRPHLPRNSVVLQFGQAPGATAVSVLRKARRPQLWKASG